MLWQNQEQFQRLVVWIGSFHTICAFLAAIGKRFGDAGLADVLMESGIVGSGSVAGVLVTITELYACIRYRKLDYVIVGLRCDILMIATGLILNIFLAICCPNVI